MRLDAWKNDRPERVRIGGFQADFYGGKISHTSAESAQAPCSLGPLRFVSFLSETPSRRVADATFLG
jgi:hypothetical protein